MSSWLSGQLQVSSEAAALSLSLVECGLYAWAVLNGSWVELLVQFLLPSLLGRILGVHHQTPGDSPRPWWIVTEHLVLFPQGFGCERFPYELLQGMPSCLRYESLPVV